MGPQFHLDRYSSRAAYRNNLEKLLITMHDPIVLATFQIPIAVHLSNKQAKEALRLLNLHHLGDEHCNEYDANFKMVAKYPGKETEEFRQSHSECRRVYQTSITASLLSNGHLSFS